ncbi:MAG: adenylate/guanylate cyclase domain-containing protein, partial [Pseudaminobacter sp.]|nr:adenylate/guanylate cyclase domain-containing protein [Pseudaminobacter sp.]
MPNHRQDSPAKGKEIDGFAVASTAPRLLTCADIGEVAHRMTEARIQRRLAAILAADVVGFSRLMEADEVGTLEALKARRRNILDPLIAKHQGRMVKVMGDGVIVEFASAVNAVQCAIDLQEATANANTTIPEARRIVLRIGINLGDVIVDGSDLYGDGVNVAARIESVCEPGRVCISSSVHDQVKRKLDIGFDDLGTKAMKNIAEPVRVYRVSTGPAIDNKASDATTTNMPSIAVLAFQNMSGDSEQEYFADGVVEDIITALSRISGLLVIARNSSFSYKGRSVDMKQIGRELGVRYLLEGSIRKAGGRLRLTAQLIRVATGGHLWAERYDSALEDVFELQDQVTASVVGAIFPKLQLAEIELSRSKPTNSMDAYDHYLQGIAHMHLWTLSGADAGLAHFYTAVELDENFAAAYGCASFCCYQRKAIASGSLQANDIIETERLARRAAELGSNDDIALATAGAALGYVVGDNRAGTLLVERALALNPNFAFAWLVASWTTHWTGQLTKGLDYCRRAMELSPQDSMMFHMEATMAFGYCTAGEYDHALSWA